MSINFLLLLVVFAVVGGPLAAGDVSSGALVFVFVVAGWILSLCLHEFGHAYIAFQGGDRSVKDRGYLTLDPVRYTDPLTSIILPAAIVAMGGIGFPGGAVYIHRQAIRTPLWRAGMSFAGPAMTGVSLVLFALPFLLGLIDTAPAAFRGALAFLCYLQATALLFNLLPVPGLDGFGIIEGFLSDRTLVAIEPVRRYAIFALFFVILAAPWLISPLFEAARAIVEGLGVDVRWMADGYRMFQFWKG